jgi:hypothetical protein
VGKLLSGYDAVMLRIYRFFADVKSSDIGEGKASQNSHLLPYILLTSNRTSVSKNATFTGLSRSFLSGIRLAFGGCLLVSLGCISGCTPGSTSPETHQFIPRDLNALFAIDLQAVLIENARLDHAIARGGIRNLTRQLQAGAQSEAVRKSFQGHVFAFRINELEQALFLVWKGPDVVPGMLEITRQWAGLNGADTGVCFRKHLGGVELMALGPLESAREIQTYLEKLCAGKLPRFALESLPDNALATPRYPVVLFIPKVGDSGTFSDGSLLIRGHLSRGEGFGQIHFIPARNSPLFGNPILSRTCPALPWKSKSLKGNEQIVNCNLRVGSLLPVLQKEPKYKLASMAAGIFKIPLPALLASWGGQLAILQQPNGAGWAAAVSVRDTGYLNKAFKTMQDNDFIRKEGKGYILGQEGKIRAISEPGMLYVNGDLAVEPVRNNIGNENYSCLAEFSPGGLEWLNGIIPTYARGAFEWVTPRTGHLSIRVVNMPEGDFRAAFSLQHRIDIMSLTVGLKEE